MKLMDNPNAYANVWNEGRREGGEGGEERERVREEGTGRKERQCETDILLSLYIAHLGKRALS